MTRWLRSGDGGNAGCACGLDSTMGNGYYGYRNYAVRPALYSTAINLKKPWISRTFGSIVRIYNAWLRSSGDYYARTAFNIAASGGDSGDLTNTRYAVRPALYSTVIN